MIDGYKIVTVTPSGRRRYLKILTKYLLKMSNIIDKHIFWVNTNVPEDIEYIERLVNKNPEFFECIYLENHPPERIINANIYKFYNNCKDPNTVYVRFDDDIVFIETSMFENFIKFRIQNPKYFLIFANIINNSICHYLHQRIDALQVGFNSDLGEPPPLEYSILNRSQSDPKFALTAMIAFVKALNDKNLDKFKFKNWVLQEYEKCSVNCISWLGSEFQKFDAVGKNEESWLSSYKPRELEKTNCIYGDFIVVHFAYSNQREYLENLNNPNLIQFFDDLASAQTS